MVCTPARTEKPAQQTPTGKSQREAAAAAGLEVTAGLGDAGRLEMGSRCQIISAKTRTCGQAPPKPPLSCTLVPSHCSTSAQRDTLGKQSQKAKAPNYFIDSFCGKKKQVFCLLRRGEK